MEIKLTSNSIQAFSSAGEYILAPEINWERHFYNCHEFYIDDSGNKISKALVELATYPDVTWHHIYQVLTIIKLLHPKHEIDCQATFDRLTVPKRLTLGNMKAELELYEILGDPARRFNPDRTDFNPLIEFLEENELWYCEMKQEENVVLFHSRFHQTPASILCRDLEREDLFYWGLKNKWSLVVSA